MLAFRDDDGDYSEVMVDSSPQILRLEETYSARSLLPTDPVVGFLLSLIHI